jgi:signal transduction histidine kinase
LLPFLAASLFAALLVALGSLGLGRRWAMSDVKTRFEGIEKTLRETSFPLTKPVLDSISGLTSSELMTIETKGTVAASTLDLNAAGLENIVRDANSKLTLNGRSFLALQISRSPMKVAGDRIKTVVVLFDKTQIDAASQRAALLPLLTGLSTVALMTAISVLVSRRLVGRMIRLKTRVQRVAEGDFESQVADASTDELGQLGGAVDSMADQLNQLWKQVNRQQSEKLLHQIAGGMAHQLRNTLTGSRMAMELHRRNCKSDDNEEVRVAIRQLEIAEEYVQRLLKVGAGQRQEFQPASVSQCLSDIESSHRSIATHLRVVLSMRVDNELKTWQVADGPTFTSAIANLMMNAMQTATQVRVVANFIEENYCEVTVADNGPGLDEAVADQVFEPFVTTKPEGMGLGLPVVRRSAKELGGSIDWKRDGSETVFTFRCQLTPLVCGKVSTL